jgi:exodeoxyribonuclease VII large subunit
MPEPSFYRRRPRPDAGETTVVNSFDSWLNAALDRLDAEEGIADAEADFAALDVPEVALSVGQLNQQIERVVAADPILSDIAVRGEISNVKAHGSGHWYFTLKDDAAQIRCCLWRTNAAKLSFRPGNGDRIVATGRVEFYGKRGEISFIVEDLRFDGQGALYEAFERLKAQLEAEGLFDPERKRPLPAMPRRIGLITSATGAVAHDVLTVLRRRWPIATVVMIPALVQGLDAAPDLLRALSWAASQDDLDVVIVARGGGSAEDLWCFNDEELARTAAEFPLPLISAIGHETDFTILDFVADLRAPTPSAAAELVAPDIEEIQAVLNGHRLRLHHSVAGEVRMARQKLEWLRSRHVVTHPSKQLEAKHARVALLRTRVRDAMLRRVKIEKQCLKAHRSQLHALDPQRVLERGYAIVSRANGSLITNATQARPGEALQVSLHDGRFGVRVDKNAVDEKSGEAE